LPIIQQFNEQAQKHQQKYIHMLTSSTIFNQMKLKLYPLVSPNKIFISQKFFALVDQFVVKKH